MFEEFYGFSATPFSRSIPVSALYNSINLRCAYSNIVHAKDDEQRYLARKTYLKLKNYS